MGMGNAWSLQQSDIIINPVLPNASAGEVKLADGEAWLSGRTVKIIVTPASGFKTKKSLIIVEKMVDPNNRAPRRTSSGIGQFTLTGPDDWVTAATTYTFTIPEDYDGAYITATFVSSSANAITSLDDIDDLAGTYELAADIDASGLNESLDEFKGTLDGKFHKIYNLSKPLFSSTNGAIIRNITFESVDIDVTGNAGAVTGEAKGATRIYNCGILPSSVERDNEGNIIGFSGSSVGGTGNVGGLVGTLSGTSRVINCYSYANVSGGSNAAGIVGNNSVATTMSNLKTMVMNCMFYGNITGATTMKPVYAGQVISNAGTTGVNGYNYYRTGDDVTFDDNYANFAAYYCTLPAEEEYLTRFEYYRSILNSNKKLCTWWINGTSGTAPTDAEVESIGIAKWVLDPSIAPYPILKEWGKYPSVINQDPEYVWNPKTQQKVSRTMAEPYQGKRLGTISVTVNAGAKHAGSGATSTILSSVIVMDMDTLNHDYCYAKIQLPYYNELFGDPSADAATEWDKRYGGNYKDYVVTGWKITAISGGTTGSFKGYSVSANGSVSSGDISPDDTSGKPWEDGFNFADRNSTNKDLYSKSGRVFAQGGYFYVPEGVSAITIEAYWGKAVYLHNKEHSLDRVNVASGGDAAATAEFGTAFSPAGSLPTKFQNIDVQTTLQEAISKLTENSALTVYDQAIVLIGNVQVKNRSAAVGNNNTSKRRPFTIMSIDEDMDNEPDYCLEFQFRQKTDRPGIHPVRFDFLPVPELGLAIRTDEKAYAIGVFIPQGHFEITETSFMHTTQFEYDGDVNRVESPIILNGGHFEQIVVRYGPKDKVNYFLLGGHFRMKRFTPGYHASNITGGNVRHCVVNAIGGDYPEFYLSGIYKPDLPVNADNPHCYVNGGRFGTMAGAGYEQINGDVTFMIDHAIIEKFYGGGINAAKPVTGKIDVTINNSIVYDIYCGGPEVGPMTKAEGEARKTVTTTANNTIFNKYFGGGNGGTSYYRENKYDNDIDWPSNWKAGTYGFPAFNPLNTNSTPQYDGNKGYHDLFEFEVFNSSNGLNSKCVARTFIYWAQFGTTTTGTVTNKLTNCTIENNFYGGGNLGNVDGDVISTLTNTHVKGSAFGAGFSAEIPRLRMHDKSDASVRVPHRNKAGQIDEQGSLEYVKDNGKDRYYRWTNDNNGGNATTNKPTYWSEADNEWKCYTPISLVGLGEVSGSVTLTINGTTTVGKSVYGGGEESGVGGNTTVSVESGTIGVQGDGGVEYGNVYGGGKGKAKNVTAGYVKGNTTVNISQASTDKPTTIYHNVYGGGAYGSVGEFDNDTNGIPNARKEGTTGGNTTVTITGGTFGSNGKENGMVFGSSRGDVATPEGTPAVDPNDRMAWVFSTQVNIGTENAATGPAIKGSVYGSGENGHTLQNTVLNINSGKIGITDTSMDGGASYGYRGNVYGGGCGTDKYDSNGDGVKDAYNPLAGIVKGKTTINIKGGHVVRNVYGAGAMGSVGGNTAVENNGKTTITVTGGRIGYDGNSNNDGCIFGAARGEYGVSVAGTNLANVRETAVTINYATTPTGDNEGKTEKLIAGSVFGGGEAGTVEGSVAVNMMGGLILKDVYGGGALANTQTSNWDATANENAGGWATGKTSASATTTVSLTGGIVKDEVFGGGLGEAGKPAYVFGDVTVELNKDVDDATKGCVVGQVFGCNNVNGTPKGNVTVHVYKTQNTASTRITNPAEGEKTAKVAGRYDVTAVYGGGNNAAYYPTTDPVVAPEVIIDGCDRTSIASVYGGGNAASVPATNVTVNGTYEINYLFGGGNGAGEGNPGANIGIRDDNGEDYGTGNATATLLGGTIHEVYGGSNTLGNVRGGTQLTVTEANSGTEDCCTLKIDHIYGAGKNANQDGTVSLVLGCLSQDVTEIYGGAEAANIGGGVNLTLTSGHFEKVFGGNNISGTIKGPITLTLEETGCRALSVDQLFGCGNQAAYSIYGYVNGVARTKAQYDALSDAEKTALEAEGIPYKAPEVNIVSCTSVGKVFGGGLGTSAKVYGSPTVNINQVPGDFASSIDGKLGPIGDVYGGGSEADVYGNTVVNVGTATTVTFNSTKHHNGDPVTSSQTVQGASITNRVYGGGLSANVHGNTVVNIGTVDISETGYEGVHIGGDVFGGGEGKTTQVTGNVNVNIGKVTYENNVATEWTGNATIKGDVYGGSALGSTNNGNTTDTSVNTTTVTLSRGTIEGNVYGGGLGQIEQKSGNEVTKEGIEAKVYGDVLVTLNKDVADNEKGCVVKKNIFGCNNLNGSPKGDVTVHVYKTQNLGKDNINSKFDRLSGNYDVLAVYGGGNLSAYVPTDLVNGKTNVIIDGCDLTSIKQVYGGGNAASTPATNVTVNGTYEILELFGGGNGEGNITVNDVSKANPGANVGFKDYSAEEDIYDTKEKRTTGTSGETFIEKYVYGSGKAALNIHGGTIHRVFGGSNTKGNVRQSAITMLDTDADCTFNVDEAYGGGKSASMDAEAQLLMACIPGLKAVYGGAEAADLHDNVTLNITNGTFDRIFGGNNISGRIHGAIKINIEETGCKPIIIGELYGGGNRAAYSVYGYKEVTENDKKVWKPRESATDDGTGPETPYNDPEVNVKSCTSIGAIYGGGYGETAIMVGNPTVNINEVVGTPTTYPTDGDYNATGYKGKTVTIDGHAVALPAHTKGKIGAIGQVFGGGNAAPVIGNTNVNVGNLSTIDYETKGSGEETPRTNIPVIGVDIRGNVYGGGNNAEVTGNTNVVIGKENANNQ
jgi:hypothetical protein